MTWQEDTVNRLFALSFKDKAKEQVTNDIIFRHEKIKNYNVMIDGQHVLDQPVRNDLITYDNISKLSVVQGDDYTTVCLLDYDFFNFFFLFLYVH